LPTLNVPGATLYYELDGTGPVLLMIPGGPADAGAFAALTRFLTDRYTVVAYDPRGNSRSVPDDPTADQDLDVHGGDAAALLAAVTNQPAYVLGSSWETSEGDKRHVTEIDASEVAPSLKWAIAAPEKAVRERAADRGAERGQFNDPPPF
jgi:alpha/beta hydrolase fold